MAAPRTVYAGLVSRLAALLVDVGLLTIATTAVGTLPVLAWQQVSPLGAPAWLGTATAVAAGLLPVAYFTGCWWLTGQSVGGLLTGIAVVDTHGGRLSLPHAFLRAAGGLLLAPLWLIGLLAVLWGERRRAWHDRVFRTAVRYAAPTPARSGADR